MAKQWDIHMKREQTKIKGNPFDLTQPALFTYIFTSFAISRSFCGRAYIMHTNHFTFMLAWKWNKDRKNKIDSMRNRHTHKERDGKKVKKKTEINSSARKKITQVKFKWRQFYTRKKLLENQEHTFAQWAKFRSFLKMFHVAVGLCSQCVCVCVCRSCSSVVRQEGWTSNLLALARTTCIWWHSTFFYVFCSCSLYKIFDDDFSTSPFFSIRFCRDYEQIQNKTVLRPIFGYPKQRPS